MLDKVLFFCGRRRGDSVLGIMSGQIWEGILSGGDFVRGDSVQGDYVRIPIWPELSTISPRSGWVCQQRPHQASSSFSDHQNRGHRIRARTKLGDRAFSVAASSTWNNLPPHLRHIDSHRQFQKQLKTYLFEQAFNSKLFLHLSV